MGDPRSGERAATFYTLIANRHRAGLNAEIYLTEFFERLPGTTTKTVREITPGKRQPDVAPKHEPSPPPQNPPHKVNRGAMAPRLTDT